MRPLTIGAVAYDPKVVTIWEGFGGWLAGQDLPTDYVLYANYERQVDGLLAGEVDVAWNSPLAWLETDRRARSRGGAAVGFAMRDTDQDLTSVIVARADGPIRSLADLRGRRIAVGASDSPQATLIPLLRVHEAGVVPGRDVEVVGFEVAPGKHGDHVGGERDAVRALVSGAVDAAALLDANQLLFAREGTLPAGWARVVDRTAPFDHCLFTGLVGRREADVARFGALLMSMSWDDPAVRPLLELEGLRAWRPGRTTGFDQLARAVDTLEVPGAAAVRAFVAGGVGG
ncbi:MAG: PhnD/SsuA/transferrin family substrate-binding protein [Myxococcota bacterium]